MVLKNKSVVGVAVILRGAGVITVTINVVEVVVVVVKGV